MAGIPVLKKPAFPLQIQAGALFPASTLFGLPPTAKSVTHVGQSSGAKAFQYRGSGFSRRLLSSSRRSFARIFPPHDPPVALSATTGVGSSSARLAAPFSLSAFDCRIAASVQFRRLRIGDI
jgi:hypothetical protein